MAKSIRSKVKRRFRTAKRGVVKRTVSADRSKQVVAKLGRAAQGIIDETKPRRNAFRSDDPEAFIPQHSFTPLTDFRSEKVAEAGFAISGNRRVTHPVHLISGNGEEVMQFGPGGGADADAEELPAAKPAPPPEDDRMHLDGTSKNSRRDRRRSRNKKGTTEAPGFSFWGRRSGKR
mmetsp:Transcript_9399/g.24324  ORF Transcript_9399/g.24324 Transcript_9399/m.24324 type:complete len:176 (+) Transcript_9399:45-572(+)